MPVLVALLVSVAGCSDRSEQSAQDENDLVAFWSGLQTAFATPGDSIARGRAIYILFSSELQALVGEASAATLATVRRNPAAADLVTDDAQQVVFRLLGELAQAKQAQVARLTLHKSELSGDQATLVLFDNGREAMRIQVSRTSGTWKLNSAPDLLQDENSLFQLPSAGDRGPVTGIGSPAKLAQAWKQVLNSGDGWQAYHLFSSASQKRLKRMVNDVGGSGAADVVRILEKTLRDRQRRGQTAKTVTATAPTGDRASIEIAYNGGRTETMEAVRDGDEWRLTAPF